MRQFSEFILNGPKPNVPVKVAIIDDGVHKIKGGYLKNVQGISFNQKPWYISATGHGTLMADLVYHVCPQSKLYIARIDEVRSQQGHSHPTMAAATKVNLSMRYITSVSEFTIAH